MGRIVAGSVTKIKNKQYFQPYKDYKGEVLLVAINYDENKTYSCKIEKWEKE